MARRKKTGFFAGSGKFLLAVLVLYTTIYLGKYIIEYSKSQVKSFTVSDVEIEGNNFVSRNQILKICGFATGQKEALEIDTKTVAADLLNLNYVAGVSITKRLPRTLNITIVERQPVAFIYGRGLNLIDANGYLMPVPEKAVSWDLPFISGIGQPLGKLGQKTTSSDAVVALHTLLAIDENYPLLCGMISEINLKNDDYIKLILVRGGATVRIARYGHEKELYVLQKYVTNYLDWSHLNKIEYIDLRFDNQLIVKEKV